MKGGSSHTSKAMVASRLELASRGPPQVISSKFGEDGEIKESDLEKGIPEGFMGLDVGAGSSEKFAKAIQESKTLIWNGPMGVFEMDSFAKGTSKMMDEIVKPTPAIRDRDF